ncbi:MAG TPA: STAS domain-containing protein [Verrucomicrobiae bacterium]|jgi:anti-anti-sigma factor|nr:STAS domain-containing protein [Verrucomicrobiae bacterium]
MEQIVDAEKKVLTLRLRGDLTSGNTASAQAIAALLQAARDEGRPWRNVELDLREARMVDSVGLNMIVAVFKSTQRGGGRLRLNYSDANVHRTFVFTRLDQHLDLVKV